MTLSNVSAAASLLARMAATQTAVAGSVQLGHAVTQAFPDANIMYSCRIRGLNATNAGTLDAVTGYALSTGYTVVDGNARDWEGNFHSGVATILAVLIKADADNPQYVNVDGGALLECLLNPGGFIVYVPAADDGIGVGAFTLDFTSAGIPAVNNVEVTILGKSSG